MNKKNILFIISTIVILGIITAAIFFYTKTTEKPKANDNSSSISYNDYKENIKVDGFYLNDQPYLGNPESAVKIVIISDFKCPYCKMWETDVFPKMYDNYIKNGKAVLFAVNYQMLGPDSIVAGMAGEAIYHQNNQKFWEFYRKLYKAQQPESTVWATKTFLKDFVKKEY